MNWKAFRFKWSGNLWFDFKKEDFEIKFPTLKKFIYWLYELFWGYIIKLRDEKE